VFSGVVCGGRTLDTELVAFRVGHDHEPAAVVATVVGHDRRAEALEPFDLGVATLCGLQVEVEAVLHRLGLRHGDEQQPRPGAVWREDEPFAIAREVRVLRVVDVAEGVRPEAAHDLDVGAIDGDVTDG
jgi:hypothetical protein